MSNAYAEVLMRDLSRNAGVSMFFNAITRLTFVATAILRIKRTNMSLFTWSGFRRAQCSVNTDGCKCIVRMIIEAGHLPEPDHYFSAAQRERSDVL
jgi:hypothetical protein